MVMLALAIAAGLTVGLLAFRTTSGTPASSAVAAATANEAAPANRLPPSASDDGQTAEQPVQFNPASTQADAQDGGPSAPVKDPPPTQARLVGDAPPPGDSAPQ